MPSPSSLVAAAQKFRLYDEDFSTESILVNDFGLPATPCQRAMARTMDGLPLGELALREDVRHAFRMDDLSEHDERLLHAQIMLLISGIRTAKSQMAAANCISATQRVNLDHLSHGEIPRIPLVSLYKDLAAVNLGHILGNMEASPRLNALLAPPSAKRKLLSEGGSSSILVRHPTGRWVEIRVSAGAKAGSTLIARWLAGCVFDEAPRMAAAEDGVINLSDQLAAVLGRMLPGARILMIGSAHAPRGVAYDLHEESIGKPSRKCVAAVPHAETMNPSWWTPERQQQLRETDITTYYTDVEGKFIDPSGSLLSSNLIVKSTRVGAIDLPPEPGFHYVATMDPATRRNAWTFGVFTKTTTGVVKQVCAREWIPETGEPLSPRRVLLECWGVLQMYGIDTIVSDQHAFDAMLDIALEIGVYLREHSWNGANKDDMYKNLLTRMRLGLVELSPHPNIKPDLQHVVKVATGTTTRIELRKDGKGRHADWAPTIAIGVSEFYGTFQPEDRPPELDEQEQLEEAQVALEMEEAGYSMDYDDYLFMKAA